MYVGVDNFRVSEVQQLVCYAGKSNSAEFDVILRPPWLGRFCNLGGNDVLVFCTEGSLSSAEK